MISFAFCVLISTPFYFVGQVSYFDAPINPNSTYRIWYWDINSFGRSLTGKKLVITSYVIRDVCFLAAEVFVNIYSICLFKKFFKKNATVFEINNTTYVSVRNISQNNLISFNERMTIVERKMTILVILCFFSILMHIFYMALSVYFYFLII